ncbi:MipA/OmpV family protein [Azospirillum sp. B506]|uniref:MipA/OmpV family protein n=1 Tax=Azospirillum sp. B506 TaxID=137721 RepID=UPI0003491FC0|nr:MipA/OmpV family protein [Azospirillum sp. B506]
MRRLAACALAAVALAEVAAGTPRAALADGATAEPAAGGSTLALGAGVVAQPAYPGAARTDWSAAPYLSAEFGQSLAIDSLDGVRVTVLHEGILSLGAIARYQPGRSSRSLPARLRGLNGLSDTAELGGFATVESGPLSLDLVGTEEVRHGRRGAVLEAHAALSLPLGDPAEQQGFSLGPFVKAANQSYLQRNFGVDAGQAAATGLDGFSPHAGVDLAGLEANGAVNLIDRWSVRGFASWGRMVGSASNSPILRDGGRSSQLSSGLFLVFTP